MSVIKVQVIDQTLTITDSPVIATGGINENAIQFAFDNAWAGMTKVAIFYQDKEHVYRQTVDENDRAIVPQEATTAAKPMFFGVFGASGDVIQTSEVIRYAIIAGAITEDLTPGDPTPDIYQQMILIYNQLLTELHKLINDTGSKTSVSTSRNLSTFWNLLEYVASYMDTNLTTLLNKAIANSSTQGVIDLLNNSVIPKQNAVKTDVNGYFEIITANKTITIPSNVNEILVCASGGGGGGGGGGKWPTNAEYYGQGGGGGNAGNVCRKLFKVTPGSSISITIGAGGAGGVNATQGSAGGATVVGGLVTCAGGTGGKAGSTNSGATYSNMYNTGGSGSCYYGVKGSQGCINYGGDLGFGGEGSVFAGGDGAVRTSTAAGSPGSMGSGGGGSAGGNTTHAVAAGGKGGSGYCIIAYGAESIEKALAYWR